MEKAKTVKGPWNRRNMGPRPRLNNPLKTLSRLIKYTGKILWHTYGYCSFMYVCQCICQC